MRNLCMRILFLCLIFISSSAFAETNADREMQRAWNAAFNAQVTGPADIPLLEQGMLHLPENFLFIPKTQAVQLMKAMGNGNDPNLVGLICSEDDEENWLITVDYIASGYIADDDAKSWDVDELYNSVIEGTKIGNEERKKKGIPELEILGWVQKPQYNETKKHLVWSIYSRDKGDLSAKPEDQTINYNTYVLGREGYLELSLVTDMANVEYEKPLMSQILNNTSFTQGKRYEDFNPATDKAAEYGLAALIAGGFAAKKLGLLALLAKFAKPLGVAIVALGVLIAKLWKRNKDHKETVEK